MPTQTFFNLPEEKRNAIIAAARREFSLHVFEEASINQIIKDADISRGSFYMYFEDKADLFMFLFESLKKQVMQLVIKHMYTSKGNIRELTISLHEEFFRLHEEKENQDLIKNTVLFFQNTAQRESPEFAHKDKMRDGLQKLYPFLQTSGFKDQTKEFVESVVQLHIQILRISLVNAFIQKQDFATSKRQLLSALDILENGYVQKEGSK